MKHPDYDIDFKPAIARFDWDQTYDVLEFVYLPQGFDQLMDLCGIPAFELMAIDRYTPYNYLWADEYSDYVYNFLKQFNFSPHNSILERLLRDESNALIKDENNNNITVPAFVFSGEKYSKTAEYKVTLTEGKYEITGLVYQGWKDGIIGSIPTINQAFYRFQLEETTEIDLNQIINHWCTDSYPEYEYWWGTSSNSNSQFCINSLVLGKLNGSQWQSVAVDAPKFLFYQDITDYWGEVSNALLHYFENVFNNYKGFKDNDWGKDTYPIQSYLKRIEKEFTNTFVDISDYILTYEKFPDFLINYCYLQRGNNNKWQGNFLSDLGILPNSNFLSTDNLENFAIYNNIPFVKKVRWNTPFYWGVLNEEDFIPLQYLYLWGYYLIDYPLPPPPTGENEFLMDAIREVVPDATLKAYNFLLAYSNLWTSNPYAFKDLYGGAKPTRRFIDFDYISGANGGAFGGMGKSNFNLSYAKSIKSSYISFGQPYKQNAHTLVCELELTIYTNNQYFQNLQAYSGHIEEGNIYIETILWDESEWMQYQSMSDQDYLDYLLTTKAQLEAFMVDSVRMKEIHACLGAGEFAYYDNNGTPTPYQMHIARNIDFLMKSFGIYYNPDGSIQSVVLNPAPPESEP